MHHQAAFQPLYIPAYNQDNDHNMSQLQYHAITTGVPNNIPLTMSSAMQGGLPEQKARMEPWQSQFLESIFDERQKPATKEKEKIANLLGFRLEKINNWFQNRRAKEKVEIRKRQNSGSLAMRRQVPRPAAINTQRSASYSSNGPSSAASRSPLSSLSPGAAGVPPLPERTLRHAKSYGAVASGRIRKVSVAQRSPSGFTFPEGLNHASLARQTSFHSSLSSPTLSMPSMPNTPDVPQVPEMPQWLKQSAEFPLTSPLPFTPSSDLPSSSFAPEISYTAPWQQLQSLHQSQEAAMNSEPPMSAPPVNAQQMQVLEQLEQLRSRSMHQPAPFTAPAMQQDFHFGFPSVPLSDGDTYWTQLEQLESSQQSAMMSGPPMSAPLIPSITTTTIDNMTTDQQDTIDQLEALRIASLNQPGPFTAPAFGQDFSFDLSSNIGDGQYYLSEFDDCSPLEHSSTPSSYNAFSPPMDIKSGSRI